MAGYAIPLNNATYPLIFHLVNATDGQSPVLSATPTVTLSKDGAAYAAPAGAVSEIGNGDYKVAANATDANALGPLVLNATATGAAPASVTFLVVAYNPFDVNLNLPRLDAAVSTRQPSGNVTIGGYATGEDPATLVLSTPANKLASDVSGRVTLTPAEHTNVATDVQTGLSAQGFTLTRAGYLDTLNGLVSAIWATAISNAPTVHTVAEVMSGMWSKLFGKITESGTALDYTGTDGTTNVLIETYTPAITGATGRTTNRS